MIEIVVYLTVAAILWVGCIATGGVKKWREYYPTIVFLIAGSLGSKVLYMDYPVWTMSAPPFGTGVGEFIWCLFIYPPTTIMYLNLFPTILWRKVMYVVFWGLLFFGIEYVSVILGYITYHNGWGYTASVVFLLAMFLILYIHHKNPVLAWGASFIGVVVMLLIFKVSLWSIR